MQKKQKLITKISIVVSIMLMSTMSVSAMHIAEGFLPLVDCVVWVALYIPFLVWGFFSVKNKLTGNSKMKILFAMAGAFCFVLSALKMPSITGSSSHPTGTGLGTILFGPASMSIIGLIVLIFQALLLAHGGITTLGANAFSMAVVGPFVGFGVFVVARKLKAPDWLSVFLCAMLSDLLTYVTTSFQLAMAFNNQTVSFMQALVKFLTVFAITQIPLSVVEGILTVLLYKAIKRLCTEEFEILGIN